MNVCEGRKKEKIVTPWYKVVTPRKEVREGRSFSPDEFAIALEQVVAGTAPADYSGPDFLRLANALSALYPRSSREKRPLDAMPPAAPK